MSGSWRSCPKIILFLLLVQSVLAQASPDCVGENIFSKPKCLGDETSREERELFDLLTAYRTANKLPQLRLSPSLSLVANRKMLDLKQNIKKLTHSWSNCPYDIADRKTWNCVNDAPLRLKCGYNGQGFETLFHSINQRAKPAAALNAWKKSELHNSIILNLGMFANLEWDEVGVAIDGEYAALWFGRPNTAGASEDSPLPPRVSTSKPSGGKTKKR